MKLTSLTISEKPYFSKVLFLEPEFKKNPDYCNPVYFVIEQPFRIWFPLIDSKLVSVINFSEKWPDYQTFKLISKYLYVQLHYQWRSRILFPWKIMFFRSSSSFEAGQKSEVCVLLVFHPCQEYFNLNLRLKYPR